MLAQWFASSALARFTCPQSSFLELQRVYESHAVAHRERHAPLLSTIRTSTEEPITEILIEKKRKSLTPMLLEGPDKFIPRDKAVWSENTILFGKPKKITGYLTIGIPVVRRRLEGNQYLYSTLLSIIAATTDAEKENITIVVFMSDFNKTWNLEMSQKISEIYTEYVNTGFLQVIHSPTDIYPDLGINANLNRDSKDRVAWRSKQNIDYAYLMWYSKEVSEFYLQIEDDVVAASHFYADIRNFIGRKSAIPWIVLEFSRMGFIGKLMRSDTLPRLVTYLLSMYNVLPCDLLLTNFRILHNQVSPIFHQKGLFQHVGKISSLRGKLAPWSDSTFKGSIDFSRFDIKFDNPVADIISNMEAIPGSSPQNAYLKNNDMLFFAVKNLRANDFYRIVYPKPINISRIVVSTGHPVRRTGAIKRALVKIGEGSGEINEQCIPDRSVGSFYYGEFDSEIQEYVIPFSVKCISIESQQNVSKPIVIRKIWVKT